jgi:PAS domain S-box-containing protein
MTPMPTKPNSPADAAELRRRAEARLIEQRQGQRSKAGDLRSEFDTARMLHELEVHQIELEMQNDELDKARNELELALVKCTDLYDFDPVGYFSLDESGMILETNATSAALLGVERSRLINRRLLMFISPTSRSVFLGFLKKVLTEPKPQACEALLLKETGGTFWAGFRAMSAIFLNGTRKCWFGFGDITARKQVDQLTSREKEVLRLIASGRANKQSAADLGIAMRTVEKHRAHLMKKLDIHETAGLTRYAISAGVTKSNARLNLF